MNKILKSISLYLNKEKALDLSIILFLSSLPLSYGFINFFLILFLICTIINYNLLKFKFSFALLLPIIYYILGLISITWSIDPINSEKSLIKTLLFIAIPIIFSFLPRIDQNKRIFYLNQYAFLTVISSTFFLIRALIRYYNTHDINYFFYHNLVSLKINAIYVSIFVSFALMIFLLKASKKYFDYLSIFILFIFLILLSSKNIILITLFGIILSFILKSNIYSKKSLIIFIFSFFILLLSLSSSIKKRFNVELQNISKDYILDNGDTIVSLDSAWNKDTFEYNYIFNGLAFRVYQIRIFKEFLKEDHIFWTGFGANATKVKIIEKQKQHNIHPYYGELNFHNQYIQTFSEIGVVGFILLISMLILCLLKSLKNKDFLFFFFTILMISIFCSESLFHRERGVIFFILLYAIFNVSSFKEKNIC